MLTEQDWQIDEFNKVDLDWVRKVYNCYEESALELVLQLAQDVSAAEPSETTALTIDTSSADLFLRHLYAVQYDKSVRIDSSSDIDLRFNPAAVSLLITSYVQRLGNQDLVLLGAQGGLGDNRQTGFLVAERLGWPCIGDVIDVVHVEEPSCLRVTSRRDGTIVTQVVRLPLVLVIGNVLRSPFLRVPTLKEKLLAKSKQIQIITPADLAITPDDLTNTAQTLLCLTRGHWGRSCTMVTGKDAREKAEILYSQYLSGRLPE